MLQRSHNSKRPGVTTIETIVALGLLVTALSATASLMVRHNRLLADGRAYRLAVDELSNRLDLLAGLSEQAAEEALAAFAEAPLKGPLSDATLAGVIDPLQPGRRITLTLRWGPHSLRPDVTLAAWSFDATEEEP